MFNRAALLTLTIVLSCYCQTSEGNSTDVDIREEVVVVATRDARASFTLPYSVYLIRRADFERSASRSMPQALRDTPGIMVQETAFGQGSPFIRGFTGFRNVLLVDGIRINNAVMRDGPNQYWATIDPFGLAGIEIVNAPASTLYGSDAVGGAVNALTADPFLGDGRFYLRTSSAEASVIGRIEQQFEVTRASALGVGITGKHFGDLEGGNSVGTQSGVGYDEHAADLRWASRFDSGWRLDGLINETRQNNVPRTHRTVHGRPWHGTVPGSDLRRELDQQRRLGYLRMTSPEQQGPVSTTTMTLSFAQAAETRERTRGDGRRDLQGFDVNSLGTSMQFSSDSRLGDLIYGVEYHRDKVDSFSSTNAIQGPVADDASYASLDFFIQDTVKLAPGSTAILGARLTRVRMNADRVSDPTTGNLISLKNDWGSTVFSARWLHEVIADEFVLFAGVAEAFRAPNLSDLTRFDSSRSGEFEIPAPGLEPEEFLSFEVGARSQMTTTSWSGALFYTRINELIQRFPTGRSVAGETEITKANIGRGWVKGVEFQGQYQLTDQVLLRGTVTWMDGEADTFPGPEPIIVREPIDRLMPLTGSLRITWQSGSSPLWAEVIVRSAGQQDRLSTRDVGDTSRIPPGGTPGYGVWQLSSGYQFGNRVKTVLTIDNVGDIDYRVHGSGTNMPGRNLMLSVDVTL